jgi:hypothetical protein
MNGLHNFVELNIFPLGSYDFIIGMDWLDLHYVFLDCHNNTFACIDDEGKKIIVKGIP